MKDPKILERNYKECEVHSNKNYGTSQTDMTHFKPNVSVMNSLIGASNNIGLFDENEEIGKIRAIATSSALDIAEKDEVLKNEYQKASEIAKANIKEVMEKAKTEEVETKTTEITE